MSARSAVLLDGRDKPRRTVTTGYAAKAFNVAPRTISKWFDAGVLEGFRIPFSGDRRIYLDSIRTLAAKFGILPRKKTVRVLVGAGPGVRQALADALTRRNTDEQEVKVVAGPTRETTIIAAIDPPDVSILDLEWFGRADGLALCDTLRGRSADLDHFGCVVAACDETDPEGLREHADLAFGAGEATPEEIVEKVWQTLFPLDDADDPKPPRPSSSAAALCA